jgi:hypothetical protein
MLGEVFVIYREWNDRKGLLCKEWVNEAGVLHREDGPAHIQYNCDGSIKWEQFCVNGRIHRESGPADIFYYSDGSVRSEFFYIKGVLHREDGPACIQYNFDGSILSESFYLYEKCFGRGKVGFWALWDKLNNQQRQALALLKYLSRYS